MNTILLPIRRKENTHLEAFALKMLQTNLNRITSGWQPLSYLNYDIHEGRLCVAIHADHPCTLSISVFQVKLFGRNCEKAIYHDVLQGGKHTLDFGEEVLTGFGTNFLSISVNGRAWYMQRI